MWQKHLVPLFPIYSFHLITAWFQPTSSHFHPHIPIGEAPKRVSADLGSSLQSFPVRTQSKNGVLRREFWMLIWKLQENKTKLLWPVSSKTLNYSLKAFSRLSGVAAMSLLQLLLFIYLCGKTCFVLFCFVTCSLSLWLYTLFGWLFLPLRVYLSDSLNGFGYCMQLSSASFLGPHSPRVMHPTKVLKLLCVRDAECVFYSKQHQPDHCQNSSGRKEKPFHFTAPENPVLTLWMEM